MSSAVLAQPRLTRIASPAAASSRPMARRTWEAATLPEEQAAPALTATVPPDDLTVHNVHAYFTRMLAQRMGSELVVESGQPNRLCFSVTVPA